MKTNIQHSTFNIQRATLTVLLGLSLILDPCSFATLTVTIAPGYQFSDGERPTVGTLNQLGEPTATISGTVDGSTGLSAGSVTGTLLSDSVPDGLSLGYNANSPRQLMVLLPGLYNATGGIVANSGGLAINFDPNFFTLATNSLANTNYNTGSPVTNWLTLSRSNGVLPVTTLAAPTNTILVGSTNNWGAAIFMGPQFQQQQQTNVQAGVTNTGATFTLSQFTSPLMVWGSTNLPHGFSNAPVFVRWVLVNQTAEAGYTAGDEVPAEYFYNNGAGANPGPAFAAGANSSNVFIAFQRGGTLNVAGKITGNASSVTTNRWLEKCYARP